MSDNPFKELVDIYNASVEKADSAGFATVYKQATDIVFNNLKEELTQLYKLNITITDVEYFDGYYLFGMGTNSVVHFHIKETPGWKYGIWWSPVARQDFTEENPTYENDRLRCNLFTQYEEEIDKFGEIDDDYNQVFTVSSYTTLENDREFNDCSLFEEW